MVSHLDHRCHFANTFSQCRRQSLCVFRSFDNLSVLFLTIISRVAGVEQVSSTQIAAGQRLASVFRHHGVFFNQSWSAIWNLHDHQWITNDQVLCQTYNCIAWYLLIYLYIISIINLIHIESKSKIIKRLCMSWIPETLQFLLLSLAHVDVLFWLCINCFFLLFSSSCPRKLHGTNGRCGYLQPWPQSVVSLQNACLVTKLKRFVFQKTVLCHEVTHGRKSHQHWSNDPGEFRIKESEIESSIQ